MTTDNMYAICMKNLIIRKCFGCKTLKNREEMVKITLSNGKLYINPNSKITGRSVYVCKNETCIKNFIKSKGIKRGLKFNDNKEIEKIENALSC